MNLDKENVRKIRGIILFTGVVVLALIKFDLLWETLVLIWEILQPVVVGGMMAFVANLPMTFFEKKVFPRAPYPKNFIKGDGCSYWLWSECGEILFLFVDIFPFLWYTVGERT